MLIAEFCTWCREYIVKKNVECKICESCLKCRYFDGDCCSNDIVVSKYRMDWHIPDYVLGIGSRSAENTARFFLKRTERERLNALAIDSP
jgi:hypothetical protein